MTKALEELREKAEKVIRPLMTETLNLTYDQRAYSWHEMQYVIDKLEKAIRSLPLAAPFSLDRAQVEELVDALRWYATHANYRRTWTAAPTGKYGAGRKYCKPAISFDRGARAKFVLTQLGIL